MTKKRWNQDNNFMGVKATSKVWEWSMSEGNDRLVLLALADWSDDDGYCWPGIKRLAQKCRISERTVQRSIRAMEKAGELVIEPGVGKKTDSGFTNRYRLVIKQPGRQIDTGASPVTSRGDNSGSEGVTALSPNPSVDTSDKPLDKASPVSVKFKKPLKTEVEGYGKNIGLPESEIEAFYDYQESKGWKVGNAPMKDFQAAMRTWKRNATKFASKSFSKPGATRAVSNPDSVWTGDIWLVCDELKRGDPFDPMYVKKKFQKAIRYASPSAIVDYLFSQLPGERPIFEKLKKSLLDVIPSEEVEDLIEHVLTAAPVLDHPFKGKKAA